MVCPFQGKSPTNARKAPGKPKKWFSRLFFDARRKAIVTRIPVERAAALAPTFEVDAPPSNVGKSCVYVGGSKDLEKLRPLVLLAYEEEIKRYEAGVPDDDEPAAADAAAAG